MYRRYAETMQFPLPFLPSADVWSCGCVFSEAAIWVVNGAGPTHGLKGYRRRRMKAPRPDLASSDCFHDGEKLLTVVEDEHAKASRFRRRSDSVTQAVVNMIQEMLVEDPQVRLSAAQCHDKSKRLLRAAREDIDSERIQSFPASGSKLMMTSRGPSQRYNPHSLDRSGSPSGHTGKWTAIFSDTQGLAESPKSAASEDSMALSPDWRHQDYRQETSESDQRRRSARRSRPSLERSAYGQQEAQPTSDFTGYPQMPNPALKEPIEEQTGARGSKAKLPGHMSYKDADRWRQNKKDKLRTGQEVSLPDDHCDRELGDRDHVSAHQPFRCVCTSDNRPDRSSSSTILHP